MKTKKERMVKKSKAVAKDPHIGPGAASGTEPEAKAGGKGDVEKAKAPTKPKAPKKISGLDAAVMILQAHQNKPMSPAEITEKARAKGLWNPGGKTPAATLSSALFREIKNGGKDCRFEKVGRGLFALTGTKDA